MLPGGTHSHGSERGVRLALVQSACSEDEASNLERTVGAIEAAARDGAQVICLQELFRSRYFPQREDPAHFELAEPIPGPTTECLQRLAAEHQVVIVGSIFERRTEGVYHNSSVVIDADGSLAGLYRKMHIPHDPLYFEKFYFTPGDTPFPVVPTRYARVAPLVCWDQWFPEAARLATLRGAQLLLYPTAIGWDVDSPCDERRREREAWETVQRAHAITNGVFVAAINRVGIESGLEFWGGSFVADPRGQVLAQAPQADDATLFVECDLSLIESTRREWPFLRDRRIDSYGPLTSRSLDGEP